MMDADDPPPPSSTSSYEGDMNIDRDMSSDEKNLKIHPLPIIEMSDQHTRVTMGASPIKPGSPIIGILFGTIDVSTISILDAQEIEYSYSTNQGGNQAITDDSEFSMSIPFGGSTKEELSAFQENIKTKIELHKMVFPTHEVLGWYRVMDSSNSSISTHEPTANDLKITNVSIVKLTENPIFLLMNASTNSLDAGSDVNKHDNGEEGEYDDDELPISIFELLVDNSGQAAFVNMEFELETFEPERIAVEKVLKTQPNAAIVSLSEQKPSPSSFQGNPESNEMKCNQESSPPSPTANAPSALDIQLQSFQNSIQSMDSRISIIINYLKNTQNGIIPQNPRLLRHVQNVISQLPIVTPQPDTVQSKLQDELQESLILSYVATVAKTSQAIEKYSEKFRSVYDSPAHRELRRAAGSGASAGAGSGAF